MSNWQLTGSRPSRVLYKMTQWYADVLNDNAFGNVNNNIYFHEDSQTFMKLRDQVKYRIYNFKLKITCLYIHLFTNDPIHSVLIFHIILNVLYVYFYIWICICIYICVYIIWMCITVIIKKKGYHILEWKRYFYMSSQSQQEKLR